MVDKNAFVRLWVHMPPAGEWRIVNAATVAPQVHLRNAFHDRRCTARVDESDG
jgi:hypothetical protein